MSYIKSNLKLWILPNTEISIMNKSYKTNYRQWNVKLDLRNLKIWKSKWQDFWINRLFWGTFFHRHGAEVPQQQDSSATVCSQLMLRALTHHFHSSRCHACDQAQQQLTTSEINAWVRPTSDSFACTALQYHGFWKCKPLEVKGLSIMQWVKIK